MTGLAARLGGGSVTAPRAIAAERAPERDSLVLRLIAFAALAAYASAHWYGLVQGADRWRAAGGVAIAVAGALALAYLPRLRLRREALYGIAALIALLTLSAGLLAAGLEARFLLPGHWGGLRDGLDRGLSGVSSVSWPYGGNDPWVRLTILLGAPLLLAESAALSFWPARPGARRGLRAAGLVALLLLYGTAVTEHDPGAPLSRGFGLLLLIAAWLWLPRLRRREALVCAALVAGVGLASLPVAAKLDAQRSWWDYRNWNWFAGGADISFDWDHTYGPITWPRDGATLLNIASAKPHYWKVETLDRFDGNRWLRSHDNDHAIASAELPFRLERQGLRWNYFEYNPAWDVHIRVTVRSLQSNLVVGVGTPYDIAGAGSVSPTADGTALALEKPLKKGDTYTVRAYAPDPNARQMRNAPAAYPPALAQYTSLLLPGISAAAPRPAVAMPLRGDPPDPAATAEVESSPYARAFRLAQRLAAGQPSSYEVVKAVEDHLTHGYTYDEHPPRRRYALDAFLFQDKIGYCQQFSGAMALLLRMTGIPARVVTGFAPGSYNTDTKEYRVRDLDAHSWVEVYFGGIGWVSFDPTPQTSPASSQKLDFDLAGAARNAGSSDKNGGPAPAARDQGGGAKGAQRANGNQSVAWWAVGLVVLGLAGGAGGGLLAARRVRRRRALAPGALADAQLRELERAFRGLGWPLPSGTTLLGLERRLERLAGPAAAAYAARLRAHRFDPRKPGAPAPNDRRRLRRDLAAAAGGLRARLRALTVIPPGGPRI